MKKSDMRHHKITVTTRQVNKEFDIPLSPINMIPVEEVVKEIKVRGPAEGKLLERIKMLHEKSNK